MSCLNVVVAGSGSTLHPSRGQTSLLIDAGDSMILIDVGCTALNTLAKIGYEVSQINHVFITHGHYDHYCGLPLLLFIKTFMESHSALDVYTVPDARQLIYSTLKGVRGSERIKWNINIIDPDKRDKINLRDIMIKPFPAKHTIQTASLTLRYSDIKIVISSDTRPTEEYKREASSADLAVHEATFPSKMLKDAIASKHSTVNEALSQISHATLGVLYHISPLAESEALSIKNGKGLIVNDGSIIKLC
ncbi:MAG: MBL fold metallo-hydrolase [Desulfurococcales archaeon]|nr:MBL fold metallo-hydrolase [Desulfurococcales archaeon]